MLSVSQVFFSLHAVEVESLYYSRDTAAYLYIYAYMCLHSIHTVCMYGEGPDRVWGEGGGGVTVYVPVVLPPPASQAGPRLEA